jgi:uncharacterized protein with PQ loop repeat
MVIPQIVRTYRNRALGGVSILSWALSGLSSFTWLLYGIRAAEIPQIPGNVLTVSGSIVIALAVPPMLGRSRRAIAIALPALALVALATVLPPTALGFIAFGIGIVSMFPQTVRSLRRAAGEVSAVSVATWVLFGVSQACWLVYALVVDDLVVTISACWILASALVISSSELRQRRRFAPRDPEAMMAICGGSAA